MTQIEKLRLRALCGSAFSPSAPIDRMTLFAGRISQIRKITDAVSTRGRHAIMYGERGVGKTSLANILNEIFSDQEGMKIVRVNCGEQDTFRSLWLKALAEITVNVVPPVSNGSVPQGAIEHTLDNFVNEVEQLGPGELRRLLARWSQTDFEIILVFDEFDQLPESERAPFAATIKDLSDNSVNSTIVLVGVAEDVNDLFEEHASVERCLEQIAVPVMSADELYDIISKALAAIKMTIDEKSSELIVSLSQGFPHYAHLIGQQSAFVAIEAGRSHIEMADVNQGIQVSVTKSKQTIQNLYRKASQGQRKGTLFPQVLLACALAETDEMGYFGSADVRGPLCRITDKDYDIPNFAQHLDKFSSDESRGPILEKSGTSRRFRFKFRNPLVQPFIIMNGLTSGMVSGDLITELRRKRQS
jgi:Cdc6-like AAA superfamily ATPase